MLNWRVEYWICVGVSGVVYKFFGVFELIISF